MTGVDVGYWDQRADGYDHGWQAAAWQSEESQLVRFDICTDHILPGQSVLDFGCGPGDLADYLGEDVCYTGMDPSPRMLERARTAHPECDFLQADQADQVVREYDWVVAIGVWNVEPATQLLAMRELCRLWSCCRRGLAVSLLRVPPAGTPPDDRPNVRHSPVDLAVVAARLTFNWQLRADHLPNDLALIAFR